MRLFHLLFRIFWQRLRSARSTYYPSASPLASSRSIPHEYRAIHDRAGETKARENEEGEEEEEEESRTEYPSSIDRYIVGRDLEGSWINFTDSYRPLHRSQSRNSDTVVVVRVVPFVPPFVFRRARRYTERQRGTRDISYDNGSRWRINVPLLFATPCALPDATLSR